jgi:hypothetical protein
MIYGYTAMGGVSKQACIPGQPPAGRVMLLTSYRFFAKGFVKAHRR